MRTINEQRIDLPAGHSLNLVDFGGNQFPAVLFIHGSFGHARVWDFVIDALPARRRAFALDLPGHGNSGHAPAAEDYQFPALVAAVGEAISVVGTPVVLAGHSIGSAITMAYAAAHPETLAGAIFMDIDPCPPQRQADHLNETGKAPPKRYDSFERALARESRVAPGATSEVHRHLALHGYREDDSELVQKFDQGFLRVVQTWDTRPQLPFITAPALVLRGSESTVMSEDGYRDMLAGLPFAEGHPVPGASHQLHLDRPAEVAGLVERFLASISA